MSGVLARAIDTLLGPGGLPEQLPDDPMPVFKAWFDEAIASKHYEDPTGFVLSTAGQNAHPSSRMVLCKGVEAAPPAIMFFTNYQSRKAGEIAENPRVAASFYWPKHQRQVRIEGTATRAAEPESDAYFATRPTISKLGAWASEQSRELPRRSDLIERVLEQVRRFGVLDVVSDTAGRNIPRPPFWGGYRIAISRIELWAGVRGRLHDRAVWEHDAANPQAAWLPARRLFP